ncbi:MAG: hypothetical protein R3C03_23435 [Pirellulaceae bacterium]
MTQPRKRITLKSLSQERQDLIVCMHEKRFGTIADLPIVDGEPILSRANVTRRRKLNGNSSSGPTSRNFRLKVPHLKLIESLNEIQNGTIKLMVFRDGVPCEMDEC